MAGIIGKFIKRIIMLSKSNMLEEHPLPCNLNGKDMPLIARTVGILGKNE